ncbi:AAA family ATPase [Hymenobacter humi]|uniref:AAA family ATPase n=1 Tax=Hymenobacter humi TaxID=1411620 RepID=A0ABW2UBB4_9BACT
MVLLDEIEKAHPDVFNILLQVLDDGRLTDNKGRMANFKNTIIIMTSNTGADIIQKNFKELNEFNHDEVVDRTRDEVVERLKQHMRPEFLNRIDEIVMFQPLKRKEIRKIVDIQFKHIQQRLEEAGIRLEATPEVLDYLGEQGYDPQFGARPLKRVLQRVVLNELSKDILSGRVTKDSVVEAVMEDGAVKFENVEMPAV